jgi:osmotically-inducible protein OsmY
LRKGFSIMKNFQSKALIAVAVAAVALIAVMAVRHSGESGATQKTTAELVAPQVSNSAIVDALRGANVDVTKLSVRTTGGIVVLRGSADRLTAERAVATVKSLGFARVANLITERAPIDDDGIRRAAERQLANTRGLDGCTLRVSCERGILRIEGTAANELQVDLARSVLRSVEGAHEVKVELQPTS